MSPRKSLGAAIESTASLYWAEGSEWKSWEPPSLLFENGDYYQERRRDATGTKRGPVFHLCNAAVAIDPRRGQGEDLAPFVDGLSVGWLKVPSLKRLSNAFHKKDIQRALYPGVIWGSKHLSLAIWASRPISNGALLVDNPGDWAVPEWEVVIAAYT